MAHSSPAALTSILTVGHPSANRPSERARWRTLRHRVVIFKLPSVSSHARFLEPLELPQHSVPGYWTPPQSPAGKSPPEKDRRGNRRLVPKCGNLQDFHGTAISRSDNAPKWDYLRETAGQDRAEFWTEAEWRDRERANLLSCAEACQRLGLRVRDAGGRHRAVWNHRGDRSGHRHVPRADSGTEPVHPKPDGGRTSGGDQRSRRIDKRRVPPCEDRRVHFSVRNW